MADIVLFRARTPSACANISRNECGATPAAADGCGRSRSESLAKAEIRKTIILLDLALQHAWEISRGIGDPAVREVFDCHVGSIEQSLQIARDRVSEL
jgi:hypothetical protein